MNQPIIYQTTAVATGGREGSVKTNDERFSALLSLPAALGGSGGSGTNPEQLFASGYAACFASGLQFCAHNQSIAIKSVTVAATVGIGPNETNGFRLTVSLVVELEGVDIATAEALVADAHQKCPYSNATRGNIDVQIKTLVV